jgi:hypothetical protein
MELLLNCTDKELGLRTQPYKVLGRLVTTLLPAKTRLLLFFIAGLTVFPGLSRASESYRLTTSWVGAGRTQELKSWELSDLSKLKRVASREKDPLTGKMIKWEGVLVSTVLDKVFEGLSVENRAQIDLVVLRGLNGERAMVPRALILKYPIMLALQWEASHSSAENRGPIYSVVPWSTRPKILSEDLPLETFFIPRVAQIELTSYRERYNPFFLKRRTDPSAMKGEKLFVQNCTYCHSSGRPPSLASVGPDIKKPHVRSRPGGGLAERISEKDWKSILRYLNAYVAENPVSASNFFPSPHTAVK